MKRKLFISLLIMILSLFAVRSFQVLGQTEEAEEDIAKQNTNILLDSPLFTSLEVEKEVEYKQPNYGFVETVFKNMDLEDPEQTENKLTINFNKVAISPNGQFELYIDETQGKNGTGAIRVLNTTTGYLWCSDVPGIDTYVSSNSTRRDAISSIKMTYATVEKPTSKTSKSTYESEIDLKIVGISNNTVTYKIFNSKVDIEFQYTVTVTDSGIEFGLKHETIKENNPEYMLMEVQIFPYFGTTIKKEVPGYVFIPSGNGALINYAADSILSSTGYTQRYYGSDENILINNEADVLSLPIFGTVQGVNQNAMLTHIKKGSAMAKLTYIPAVADNQFNRIYNSFVYREAASVSIPGGGSAPVYDEEFCKEDIVVSYSFLSNDDANYVGMALKYQQDLVDAGVLTRDKTSGSTNVHVDVFGGETEKGILFDSFVKMTTTSQLLEIDSYFNDYLDNHIKYTLRGYYSNGYSKQTASNITFNSQLGKLSELSGLDYYLYYNPVETYNSSLKFPSNVLVSIESKKHYVELEKDEKYKFYTRVNDVVEGVDSAIDKYNGNVAFDALGYRLYGDEKAGYFRSETMNLYVASLGTEKYSLYRPNEYLLKNTDEYLTTPLYHGRLRFITDSVPFLQIVLRGYVDYYSTYLNFSTSQNIDVLKCIEYGSNPAYLVSYEPSHLLSNTLSNHLYATHFESNKETIIAQTTKITEALSGVVGETIVARSVLLKGVVKVTYSNGTSIYVNYTDSPQTVEGVVIAKQDYKVVA